MALTKPVLTDKLHYSGTSGAGGAYQHGGGGYGYGGGSHVYSSVGHSGYGGYSGGHDSHSHSSKGGGKKSVALSALTLLAFLFFLHILQTCLQDQSTENTTTTNVVVMAARTENREKHGIMKKRKGDVENLDGEYSDDNYAEKKSSTTNWEEMDKQVVTTRIKTFSKYDQPDHV